MIGVFHNAFIAKPLLTFVTEQRGHQTIANLVFFASEKFAVYILVSSLVLVLLIALRTEFIEAVNVETLFLTSFAIIRLVAQTALFRVPRTNVFNPLRAGCVLA